MDWYQDRPQTVRNDPRSAVRALAEHWGLSFEGAAWHAKNCKIIEPHVALELTTDPRRPKVVYDRFSTDPTSIPRTVMHEDLPSQAAEIWDGWATQLVLEALDEGHLSVGRARELLTWG